MENIEKIRSIFVTKKFRLKYETFYTNTDEFEYNVPQKSNTNPIITMLPVCKIQINCINPFT